MYRGTDVGKGSESRSDLDQLFSNVRAWLTLFNIGVVLSFANCDEEFGNLGSKNSHQGPGPHLTSRGVWG
jgi:hypothetical protein